MIKKIFLILTIITCLCDINPVFAKTTDYEQIQNIVLWERQARVRHLYDELANCYFEDATVATSWTKGSIKDYLKGGNRAEASPDEIIINRIGSPIIHQNKKKAYVELPMTTMHWIKVNGEEAVLTSYMRLIYRIEKRNNVWKISDLTTINEEDTLEPAISGTDLHINSEDLKGLRRSYRFLAYVRIKSGGTISNDLLGIDRPEDVAKIYAETEKWLKTKYSN